ncbi:hypothetical protein ES708_19438 [subsurface metagenome]
MSTIPPIKNGPRLTLGMAVKLLVGIGFTRLEAVLFLKTETFEARKAIHAQVMKRLKGELK